LDWRSGAVVAELAQNPGAEDAAESWLTEVDLDVRVHLEGVGQVLLQLASSWFSWRSRRTRAMTFLP